MGIDHSPRTMRNFISTLTLLTTITLHAQVPSYVPTNGLVGWWPFDGNANDESGNGNNGTVNGATLAQDRFGNANNAYFFNGTGGHINLGPVAGLLATNEFTVSAWVNIDPSFTGSGASGFLYRGDFAEVNQLGIGFNYQPQLAPAFIMRINGVQNPLYTNLSVQDGQWKHVVWMHQGSGLIEIYVDQQLIGSLNVGTMVNHNLNLHLGRLGNTNNKAYKGLGDDLGIWNRALSQPEIQGLYFAGQPPTPCVSPTAISFSGLSAGYTTSDGPVTLAGTPAGGVFIGSGVTGSTFSPAVAGEGTHSISYTYLDGNNCVNTFSLCTSVAIGMGVEPGGNALGGVRVFPNPNRGQFIVELDLTGLVGVQVFDARGALVHNEVFTYAVCHRWDFPSPTPSPSAPSSS
jgi:hypothetical protein